MENTIQRRVKIYNLISNKIDYFKNLEDFILTDIRVLKQERDDLQKI